MVAVPPDCVEILQNLPRFIYITGCDGTGKTTQARLLLQQLQAAGIKAHHVWLRFPFFFSAPLLAFARWRGYSRYETSDGVRYGYWNFRSSWLLSNIFPWLLWVDASLAGLLHIRIPLWASRTVVCERFVLDMLVDMAVALEDGQFYAKLPGRWFIRLLPANARVILLDLDPATIRSRRADLRFDRKLPERLTAFRAMSAGWSLPVVSSAPSIFDVNERILQCLGR